LKEEALDRTQWRTRFGRGYRPVVRQTTEWMNEIINVLEASKVWFLRLFLVLCSRSYSYIHPIRYNFRLEQWEPSILLLGYDSTLRNNSVLSATNHINGFVCSAHSKHTTRIKHRSVTCQVQPYFSRTVYYVSMSEDSPPFGHLAVIEQYHPI
jgi:hypothetical protein